MGRMARRIWNSPNLVSFVAERPKSRPEITLRLGRNGRGHVLEPGMAPKRRPSHRQPLELLQVPPRRGAGVPALPNPARAQFIPRGSSDPRDETKALSATRARQLMGLPSGDPEGLPLHRGRVVTICRL
jgi:hypothetical protein